MGTEAHRGVPQLAGCGADRQFFQPLPSFLNAKIARWQDIRPVEMEDEQHFDCPLSHATQGCQLFYQCGVIQLAGFSEAGYQPVQPSPGDGPQAGGLGGGKAAAAQGGIIKGQKFLWCRGRPVFVMVGPKGAETPEDGPGRSIVELLARHSLDE